MFMRNKDNIIHTLPSVVKGQLRPISSADWFVAVHVYVTDTVIFVDEDTWIIVRFHGSVVYLQTPCHHIGNLTLRDSVVGFCDSVVISTDNIHRVDVGCLLQEL